jgi:O-antigen/teichoic acid export membrane protein
MNLLKIDNLKDYATTSFGVALAQLLSFFSIPFIAKLSGPEMFGQYNYLISFVIIMLVLSSLRLEYSIYRLNEKTYQLLVALFYKISAFTALLLSVVFAFFVGDGEFLWVLLVVFLSLFSMAQFEFNIQNNIFKGEFKINALMRVVRAIIFPILFYTLYVFFDSNVYIIVVSFSLSNLMPSLFFNKGRVNKELETSLVRDVKAIILSCKSVIVYLVPAHLLSRYSTAIFVIVVGGIVGDSSAIAFYALAAKFLIAPAGIFISAISDVIKREVVKSPKKALENYYKISTLAAISAALVILFLNLYSESVVLFIMGEGWGESAKYAVALTPYFFSLIVFGPITHVYIILDKQKYDFYWQVLNAFFVTIALFVGLQYSSIIGVWFFSITFSISIFISAIICIQLVLKSARENVNV